MHRIISIRTKQFEKKFEEIFEQKLELTPLPETQEKPLYTAFLTEE